MKNHVIWIILLCIWVAALIIAFIFGMHNDIKNNKDTTPTNMHYVKTQLIVGLIELVGGIIIFLLKEHIYIAIWALASGVTMLISAYGKLFKRKK